MTRTHRRGGFVLLLAIHIATLAAFAAPGPAAAMQILDAADHAELAAEISATQVNRIALHGDRIAKVVRAPDGFAVEHDGASGDLYLRPAGRVASDEAAVTLFVGTEKGFTYRLTLIPAVRGSAQILIRNAAVLARQGAGGPGNGRRCAHGGAGGPGAVGRKARAAARLRDRDGRRSVR